MKLSIRTGFTHCLLLVVFGCLISGCKETNGVIVAFDNTTSESLFVSISGPGEGTGPIGVIAPAPNMVFRKLQVDDNDLPGEYTWNAGKFNGKFTINKNPQGTICIRIPGGLSQMPDLMAYDRDVSNSSRHRYTSVPQTINKSTRPVYTSRTAPTIAKRPRPTPEGENAEFYMVERPSQPIYVPSSRAIYSSPSVISSQGGSMSIGGFGPVYNRYSPYSSGGGLSGGFFIGGDNGYIGGRFNPQPYSYPVNHPNGVLYPGVIRGVYPRYPHYRHRRHHHSRPTVPYRTLTPTTSLNGPRVQISNPKRR